MSQSYAPVSQQHDLRHMRDVAEEFTSVPMGQAYIDEYSRVNDTLRELIRCWLLKHPEGTTRHELKLHFEGAETALRATGGMIGAVVDTMKQDGELIQCGNREIESDSERFRHYSLYLPFVDDVYRLSFEQWVEEIA